jgi:3alpha(or 20beta)-hydroxysteroid dehydrogenase
MASRVGGRELREGTEGWLTPPIGRIGEPQDVAGVVAFLLSADSAFCTGAALLVDGGMRASIHASAVNG